MRRGRHLDEEQVTAVRRGRQRSRLRVQPPPADGVSRPVISGVTVGMIAPLSASGRLLPSTAVWPSSVLTRPRLPSA